MERNLVLGIDFGTDSVRALLVDASDGAERATAVARFERWSQGRYCDSSRNQFRQHPLDHIEALTASVRGALERAPHGAASLVCGLAVDTTGSTPGPLDRKGMPLALHPKFKDNPNAMFILWKDHTAVAEAEEINDLARSWGGVDFTMYSGGVYSSEWFWSKILHVLRSDPEVAAAAWTWMENCDWIPALLCGLDDPRQVKRSRCAAGHKAMWHASFDGLPSETFLARLDPRLEGLRPRLYSETFTSDKLAGHLCPEWAARLGLPAGLPVAVGAFDAHMGAVGAGIRPYILTKVIGTSTCDILVAPHEGLEGKLVRGICGQVDGSVIPGQLGLEAGQSAFGDVFAWLRSLLLWPLSHVPEVPQKTESLERALREGIYAALTEGAERLAPGSSGILALDWLNGRRTPFADQRLRGAITGLTLGSTAPAIFRALVESTAFGARKIVERFAQEGVPIQGVIALGGVARQNPFAMQVLADVFGCRIGVSACDQACALGAAMFAAVAAGLYPDVSSAQAAMDAGFEREYLPDAGRKAIYDRLYADYNRLGAFVEEQTRGVAE
ncbi:ribulokinase [bacterium]|nr:ribulokinase [bacterium]